MSLSRSKEEPAATTEETTPKPASAVQSIASGQRSPDSSRRSAERSAAVLEYFANPTAEMRDMDAAWKEALALYGDEDSDAWVAALEDGSHPLCRVGPLVRPI